MVFFFVLFAIGGEQKVLGQQALHVAITQPSIPGSPIAVPDFQVNLSVDNIYPYVSNNYPHQGNEVSIDLNFSFKDAGSNVIHQTTLPVSFFANDEGFGWIPANFINTYWVTPCIGISGVKSVVITATVNWTTGNTYPLQIPLDISYPFIATPSGNTSVQIPQDLPNQSFTKTILYGNSLVTSSLNTAIAPSIYYCGGSPSGYLLSAVTSGGCPAACTTNCTTYTPYTQVWQTQGGGTPTQFANANIDWFGLEPTIGRDANGNITNLFIGELGHTYTVTVTDGNGATATASYTVPTQIPNQFTTNVSYAANCTGQVTITSPWALKNTQIFINGASSPYGYVFPSNASYNHTVNNLPPGDYFLNIVPSAESAYCEATQISFHIGATISPTTIGECVTALNANAGGTNYTWSTGQTTQSIVPSNTGTYTVTVTNATGCSMANYTISGANAVSCCQSLLTYTPYLDTPEYTATSGIWANGSNPFGNTSAPLQIKGNLIVPNGVVLAINNMNLNFGTLGKISVRKGGQLILNGCTLDGLCGSMWQGIQVQGDGTALGAKGKLTTKNNTQIRNALIGITNMLLPNFDFANIEVLSGSYNQNTPNFLVANLSLTYQVLAAVWTSGPANAGGFIKAENTTFTDCFQGINISWATAKYGVITNCTFNDTQGANLRYPFATLLRPEAGIELKDVDWLESTLNLCTFNDLNYGIRANRAYRPKIDDNSFNRCNVGISLAGIGDETSHMYTQIRTNHFEDCAMAMQTRGLDNLFVRDNWVNQISAQNNLSFTSTVGLYTQGCNISARNNRIENATFGAILTDTEADGSLFAGNVINNTAIAVTAEGNNTGVTMRCNHLLNLYSYGIQIRPWATNAEFGDLGIQGNCFQNQPAAFTFTNHPSFSPIDVRLNANTNAFTLEDVGASLLSSSSSGGTYSTTDCSVAGGYDLDEYCANQGYTSISDITNLISGNIQDKAIAELYMQYIEAEDYEAALTLLYQYQDRLNMQRHLVPEKINTDSTLAARQLIQQLPNSSDEEINYKLLYNLWTDLKESGRSLTQITTAEETLLRQIADTRTKSAFKAQTCLYVARGIEYPVALPTNAGETWYTVFKNDATVVNNKVSTFVPNPSTQQSQLSYHLNDQETATLSIYDYTGRIIEQTRLTGTGTYQFNASNYPAGMYVYAATIDGNIVLQDKLVIIK